MNAQVDGIVSGEIEVPDTVERRARRTEAEGALGAPSVSLPMTEAPLLELRGITKRFPGVVANDHVDFDLRKGEVHALLGENGAGKSTLMNILYGLYTPDEGEIWMNGKPVRIHSPREAIDLGIGMVHQHFMLIPVMTVAENIVLGVEPHRGRSSTSARPRSASRELSQQFGLAVDPRRASSRSASASSSGRRS